MTFNILGVDVIDFDINQSLQTGMFQRFVQRLVGVEQIHVLADHGNAHAAALFAELATQHIVPFREVGRRAIELEALNHEFIQAIGVQHAGDTVNGVDIQQRNHRALFHVSEQGDFLAGTFFNRHRTTAEQNVWLQADRAQLFHRVLGRLGLDLTGGGNVGHQRQMH